MFVTVAVHHPRAEHREAFLAFMSQVEDGVAGLPGLVEFRSWQDTQSDRLVGLARWESQEAFAAAMPTIMSFGSERREEWTDRPDDLMTLVEP